MTRMLQYAADDIFRGINLWRVWFELAREDVRDAHRRTSLGPVWVLVNYLLFVAIMVFVIRRAVGVEHFGVYVATGAAIWFLINDTISGGVRLYLSERGFLEGTTLPLSVYVLRSSMETIIRGCYMLAGAAAIVAFSGVNPSPAWFSSIAALLLIFATLPPVTLIMGVCGVIFPDMRFFVTNLMRFGTFLTPIFWSHENAGGWREAIYFYSPFTHYLEIFRGPIYAGVIFSNSWIVCLSITAVSWVAALLMLGHYQRRLVLMM